MTSFRYGPDTNCMEKRQVQLMKRDVHAHIAVPVAACRNDRAGQQDLADSFEGSGSRSNLEGVPGGMCLENA